MLCCAQHDMVLGYFKISASLRGQVLGYFTVLAGAQLPDALDLKPETWPLKPCLGTKVQ